MAKPSTSTRTSGEILRAARSRIEDPRNWTQGAFARTKAGSVIGPCEVSAACWCARGALNAETQWPHRGLSGDFLMEAADRIFGMAVPEVNDRLGHAAVLRIYDRAIQMAETEVSDAGH